MYVPVKFENDIIPGEMDVSQKDFRELNLRESHLEEFIRRNPGVLFGDETMLVVGQQVHNARGGISDLTAVDADGNIVLIEIKRDKQDIIGRAEPFEFQAIRYAASYATIKSVEDLVDRVYTAYVEKHADEFDLTQLTAAELARRELRQFLISNDALRSFNQNQRILLVASDFDDQTLSAVAWLIKNGVDIACIKITPEIIGDQGFLNIEQVLPPATLEEFFVDLANRDKSLQAKPSASTSRRSNKGRTQLPRMKQLFDWGLIAPGDEVSINSYPDSDAVAVDDRLVNYRGQEMTYNAWGKEVTGWSSVNVYGWTLLKRAGDTLDHLRMDKLAELEAEQMAVNNGQ